MIFRRGLFIILALYCCGSLMAAPPAPKDGILDDTHALSAEAHQKLATQIADFRRDLGYDVWLVTSTFLSSGQTVRYHSRDLRKAWSGTSDAILLAYDRGTDRAAISLSPSIWNRYSASALSSLMLTGGAIVSDANKMPEQRLTDFMGMLLRGMRSIQLQQTKMEESFTPDHRRLAIAFGTASAAVALVLFMLGVRSRRQDVQNGLQSHLPLMEVGARLGAPFGGGVAVVWINEK